MKRHDLEPQGEARNIDYADADQRLSMLSAIIGPMVEALGPNCEIVLHDYRNSDHSVVATAGTVTNRKVGSAMSEIGMSVLAEGDDAKHRLNYLTTTSSGSSIKSSTIVLRDKNNHVFGALCINTDVTALRHAAATIAGLLGVNASPHPTTFADDISDVIDTVVAQQLAGRAATTLTRDDRVAVFKALDQRGVFAIRRGLPRVAQRLGISRATGYAYLQEAREGPPVMAQ
jgi:predicted transcriptional regulator YheO